MRRLVCKMGLIVVCVEGERSDEPRRGGVHTGGGDNGNWGKEIYVGWEDCNISNGRVIRRGDWDGENTGPGDVKLRFHGVVRESPIATVDSSARCLHSCTLTGKLYIPFIQVIILDFLQSLKTTNVGFLNELRLIFNLKANELFSAVDVLTRAL